MASKTTLRIRFNTELDDTHTEKIRELIEDNLGVEILSIDETMTRKQKIPRRRP